MKASTETVKLIWDGLLDADGMHRYYGYLTGRLDRLADLLSLSVLVFSSGAAYTLLSHFPDWVPAAASVLAATSGALQVIRRYPHKAARCADVYRKVGRLAGEWERLWAGVYDKDDAELRAAWEDLCKRQGALLEGVAHEVPLAQGLARRSYREADRYWAESYASA